MKHDLVGATIASFAAGQRHDVTRAYFTLRLMDGRELVLRGELVDDVDPPIALDVRTGPLGAEG